MEFQEFVEQKHRSLLRFAGVLCGDARLADEVVADSLGNAFEHWHRIGRLDQPYAYVRKMVLNEYLGWRRRSARLAVRADVTDLIAPAADHADAHADRHQLVAELRRLPDKQRAAIVLRYIEGLSFGQIAAMLGSGENAVRSNISRGLARLRLQFDDEDAPDSAPDPPRLLSATVARTRA